MSGQFLNGFDEFIVLADQSFFIVFLFQKQLYNKELMRCCGVQYRCTFLLVL